MNIIGTGLSGMVGSRIVQLLESTYTFTNLSLETGVDITDRAAVENYIVGSDAPWVFHMAAMTDVDGAEKEKELKEQSKSWMVNVEATRNVAEVAKRAGKKLLYISTDFVFDGTKQEYTEEDVPNPQGWYAITKYEGEKIVSTVPNSLIIRIANPYCTEVSVRPDFVHKIMQRLVDGLPVSAPDNQLFLPTFVDDIARAIDALVKSDAQGIYHVVGSGGLSPYAVAQKIATVVGVDPSVVGKTTFEEFFKNRAPRPQFANLSNKKVSALGVHMSTFDEGIATIKHYR
jgi:dTDP-4-dehydrorhamnose reductase